MNALSLVLENFKLVIDLPSAATIAGEKRKRKKGIN